MNALRERPTATSTLGGFLRLLEVDAHKVAGHPDAFEAIRSGALQAIVVHNVYEPAVLAAVVARLERNDPGFLQTWFPGKFRSWFFGRNLNLAEPGLPGYFDEAARFSSHLREAFAPAPDPSVEVARILSALDGGRPFLSPPGPEQGQRYMFTTLRAHEEGGYIPPHFDNEQALRPTYAHLRSLVELHMTSYVLTLDRAGEGGALEVFDCQCDPANAVAINRDGASRPVISGLVPVPFRVPPGSMIILDSGRYLHRLSPVEGERKRWTACSFMALSRKRDAMYCWG